MKIKLLVIAYGVLWVVMLGLPFFSVEGYSIIRNTISHLGAQGAPFAWVINVTFIFLGYATLKVSAERLKAYGFQSIMIRMFAFSLMLTGVFQQASILEGGPANALQDQLHSIFTTLVVICFTLFAISIALIAKTKKDQFMALGMAVVSVVLSLLIFQVPEFAGIWQRLMFGLAFAWLIWVLQKVDKHLY